MSAPVCGAGGFLLAAQNYLVQRDPNLPAPEVIAQEIIEDMEAALEQFRELVTDLRVEERDSGN